MGHGRSLHRRAALVAAIAAAMLHGAPAGAQSLPAAAVLDGSGNVLVTFETGTAGAFPSIHPITGLHPGESVQALDYRFDPEAGAGLYGLGVTSAGGTDDLRLHRIDEGTGQATQVGAGPSVAGLPAAAWDIDFNPVADRVRVVSTKDSNLRLHPDTGVLTLDSTLSPAGSAVHAVAYDRVDADGTTPTTAFALAMSPSPRVTTLGGADGSPSPNLGTLNSPFALSGAPAGTAGPHDLDVATDGRVFAPLSLTTGGQGLYALATGTGVLSPVSALGAPVRAFALLPRRDISLTPATLQVGEGQTGTLTLTRSGRTSGTAVVDVHTSAQSAAGTDATFSGAVGTVTFAPGEASKTITVTADHDLADEADTETLGVHVGQVKHPWVAGASPATVEVLDDDTTPTPTPTPSPTPSPSPSPALSPVATVPPTPTPVDVRANAASFFFGRGSKPPTARTVGRGAAARTTIRIRGVLGVPAGVVRSAACRGVVTITVVSPRGLVTARKARVSSTTCKYTKNVAFPRNRVKGKRITVVLEFPGNTAVSRASLRRRLTLKP